MSKYRDEFGNIKKGTRVRLKSGVYTIGGWHGRETMLGYGRAIKDNHNDPRGFVLAANHEWVICRDQTARTEHEDTLNAA